MGRAADHAVWKPANEVGGLAGKRILLTSWGSYGDVNPYVGLAIALAGRGHRPVIATSPCYGAWVERAGVEFRPVRPDVDLDDRAVLARVMDPGRGTETILKHLLMPHLRETFTDLAAAAVDADLIVTHPVTFAGPVVAQERGLPWVSTVLAPMSFFSEHELPVFPPMPWAKRLERVPGAARMLVRMAKRITRPWTEPVRELRKERGLPPGADPAFEGQHSPASVLALFSSVLAAPQPDWPARVTVTGHIFYNGPAREADAMLEAFLAAGPPPIVFTLGSSAVGAAGDFYAVSVEAVRRLAVRAVLLVGSHPENRPRTPLPDGVIAVEYARHQDLFPRAAAIVHQGGIGTLAQALRSGRPMLVVPWGHDQPDNAHRAARLGVARIVYPRRYRPGAVTAALRALLEAPAYAERARAVGEMVRAEDGPGAACDRIEACLPS